MYQTTKKRASGPKCPVTGKRIQGVCICLISIRNVVFVSYVSFVSVVFSWVPSVLHLRMSESLVLLLYDIPQPKCQFIDRLCNRVGAAVYESVVDLPSCNWIHLICA